MGKIYNKKIQLEFISKDFKQFLSVWVINFSTKLLSECISSRNTTSDENIID